MKTNKVKEFIEKLKAVDVEISKLNEKKDALCKEYDKAVIESEKDVPNQADVVKKIQEQTRESQLAKIQKAKAIEKEIAKAVKVPKKKKEASAEKESDSETLGEEPSKGFE